MDSNHLTHQVSQDDFYDNPEEVRNFSLTAEFPDPGDDYTYPGKNSEGSYYSEEIHKKFEDLAKEPLIPADKNGYFRPSLEKDKLVSDKYYADYKSKTFYTHKLP